MEKWCISSKSFKTSETESAVRAWHQHEQGKVRALS